MYIQLCIFTENLVEPTRVELVFLECHSNVLPLDDNPKKLVAKSGVAPHIA